MGLINLEYFVNFIMHCSIYSYSELFTVLLNRISCINISNSKEMVTNRPTKFYPKYILKCFTALEWCVE